MANPSIKSSKFTAVEGKWRLVDALFDGTESMRLAGVQYLPRNPKENEEDWSARLHRTTLFNAYRNSIQQATARVFSEDIQISGYPGEIGIFIHDVDAQARDITQFPKSLFRDGLNRGVSFLLVEFPYRAERPLTLADAISSGDRPYWVEIPATRVLAAHSNLEGGTEHLTHFRFTEDVVDVSEDGLEETHYEQVKAFIQPTLADPVTFKVWRKIDGEWLEIDGGVCDGMPVIPVAVFYTNRTGFCVGSPPLFDLAELNLAHWQSSSEQRNILHVNRVPFLFVKGVQPPMDMETGQQQELEISIHSVLIGGEQADAKWIETNGTALEAGAADLKDLEEKMEIVGLSLLTPPSGGTTATENAINAAEANSRLKDMARSLADTLEQALWLTELYLGNPAPSTTGKVTVPTRFTVDLVDNRQGQTSSEQITHTETEI